MSERASERGGMIEWESTVMSESEMRPEEQELFDV